MGTIRRSFSKLASRFTRSSERQVHIATLSTWFTWGRMRGEI